MKLFSIESQFQFINDYKSWKTEMIETIPEVIVILYILIAKNKK